MAITAAQQSFLSQPTPDELTQYSIMKRNAKTQLGQVQAQNAFQRNADLRNQGLETSALTRRFDTMRERLPGAFAGRGLLNSGIYGHALTTYAQDRQNALTALATKYQQMLGQLDIGNQGANQDYQTALANAADMEQARRATLAAQLKALQA